MRTFPRLLSVASAAALLVSCDAPTRVPTTGRVVPHITMVRDTMSSAKLVGLAGMRATLTGTEGTTGQYSVALDSPTVSTGSWRGEALDVLPGRYLLTVEGTIAGQQIQHYGRSTNPITVVAGSPSNTQLSVLPVVPTVPTFTLSDSTNFSRTVTLGTSFPYATGWQYQVADNAQFSNSNPLTAPGTSFPIEVTATGTWFVRVRPVLPQQSFSEVVWSDVQTFDVRASTGGRTSGTADSHSPLNGVPDTIVDRNITGTAPQGWFVIPNVRVGDSIFVTTRARALVPASPLNTTVTILRADGVTEISSNTDISGTNLDSRDSIRATFAENHLVRVTGHNGSVGHYDVILELRRLPAAPTNIAALATSATAARITWTDVADNEASYRIERCEGAACTDFAERPTAGAANDVAFDDAGLTAGSTYRYRVRARNAIGNSVYAGPVNVTLVGPTAPSALTATTVSGTQIDLTWVDASNNETGFEVQRCSNGTCATDGDFTVTSTVPAGTQAFSATGLAVDGTYTFRVRATNNVAPSAYSATATANTLRPAPATGLTATTMSATRIDLAWTDVATTETGYSIERCATQGCSNFVEVGTAGLSANSFSDLTAVAETYYSYRVRAVNIAGASNPSNTALANTRAPGVPASFAATVVTGTRVDLSWSDTTAAETGFQVERCEGSTCTAFAALTTVAAGTSGFSDNTVQIGLQYRYRVRATGVAGNSTEAGPVLASLLLPNVPLSLTASTASATQVNLSWTDASDNETTFRIERCTGAACTDFVEVGFVTAGTQAYNDQGVTAENDYRYQIRARNAVGNSVYTTAAAANTRSAAAPSFLGAQQISASHIRLTWQDNSSNETGFRIERCAGAGCSNFAAIDSVTAATVQYENTGLAAGQSFTYRVRALNAVGASAASNTVTATTLAPNAPTGFATLTLNATRISLNWTDGSSDELGFRVERCALAGCTDFAEIGTVGTDVTVYIDSTVAAGADYRYRIRSYNIVGGSGYSDELSADTRAPVNPPTIFAATVSGTQIDLDWTDPNANEVGFIITRCSGVACAEQQNFILGANITSYSDASVQVDREYTYQISAYNNVGNSGVASIVNANTLLPAAPSALSAQTLTATSIHLEWFNNAGDANGFIIERCTGSGCSGFAVVDSTSGAVTTFTDLTALQGNIYTYIVRARNISGRSTASSPTEASTIAPDAPSSLLAETRSDTRIDLTWVDGSGDETGFYIDRCTGAGCSNFVTVDSVGADVTAFSNIGLTPSLTYAYRVRAFSNAGASTPSNTSEASTNLPAIPTDLQAEAQTTTSVALTWVDNASDEDGYAIERCDGVGCSSFTPLDVTASDATGYTDASAIAGVSYTYRIRAFNGAGNSDYSNVATTSTSLPAAPAALTADATSTTSVELTWVDASDNETRFLIERCTGAACGVFAAIDSVSAGTATFTDNSVAAGTAYRYRVSAVNLIGASAPSNVADASTVLPAAPSNLSATTFSSSQIDLAWDDNASNEASYDVERCTGVACLDFARIDSIPANTTSYSDIGLTPNVAYRYRLRARNGAGVSAYTAIVDATTDVPADPSDLTALATSTSSIRIDWTDNSTNETDFVIQRCTQLSCLETDFSDLSVVGAGVTTYTDGSLSLGNAATYRVKAINLNGASRYSNNAAASVTVPQVPSGLAAVNSTANQVALTWSDDATNELGYEIDRCTAPGCSSFARIDSVAPNTTAYTDLSGALDQTYSYRVRAVNLVGQSAYSNTATANTIRPNAPTALTATTVSATQVDLSWNDLADNENGYELERCTGASCSDFSALASMGPNIATYNDLTVVVGQLYSYRLRAYNNAGTSSFDGPATASTLLPADPNGISAVVSAPTEITLTWTDNATNEVGYRVERCTGAGCNAFVQIASIAADATQYIDGGLNSNTFYRYRLRAYNTAGVSAYTAVVSPNTFAPAAPTGLATQTVFGNRVDLTWSDAASNETGFRIERCTGAVCSDFAEVAVVGANVTSHADSTLSFGTTYRFRIRSYNGVANSAYTTAVEGNTNVPLAPSGLAAAAQSTTRIDLAWTDNGTNETGYRVERCSGPGCSDFTLLTTLPANATSHSDTPIAAATSFTYRVIATNAGSSAPSNAATATTILPAAPSAFTAIAVAGDRVDLSWTDNADNEYGTIIERCDGAACSNFLAVDTVGADVTAFSELGLTGGVIHRYRIRAYNGAGPSAYTSIAEATTNVPGIPTTLTATTFDAGRIDLAWTDNAGDELGFVIERCTGAGCTSFVAIDSVETPNTTAYNNTGLAAGTTFRYRVRAYNASGVSGASNVATAGTNVPAAPNGLNAVVVTANRIDLNWNDNADNEGSYVLERCVGTGCSDFTVLATLPIDAFLFVDASTVVNTTYRYRVRATNNAGPSLYSDIVETDTDVPAAPVAVSAVTMSATRIDLQWTDASDNEVTFRVERCAGAGCSGFAEIAQLAPGTQAYIDEPLTPNESYSYRILAVNPAGPSAASATLTATTSIPADPNGLSAVTVSANRIDLNWTDNSSNELAFVIERCATADCSGGIGLSTNVGTDVTHYSDESVSVGNVYYYRVRAQNAAGQSGNAVAQGSTLLPVDPAAQTIAITDVVSIQIVWADNSDNEDAFVVERCRDFECTDFAPLTTLGAGTTEYTDTGLDTDTWYSYRVRATNAAGSSAVSAALSVVTSRPDDASKLNATTLSATQIALDWQDNSANETGFRIEVCRGAGCSSFDVVTEVTADVTTYQVNDLDFDQSYTFRIVAFNPIGEANPSDAATTTTSLAAPASSLTATVVGPNHINLAWLDNSDNEAGFRIERCAGVGCSDFVEIITLAQNSTGYTDATLSLNASYTFRVRPFNAVGPSAYSNEATNNTFLPADPSNITTTPITVNRIDVTWQDNADNENLYVVEACLGSGCTNFSAVAVPPGNTTSYSWTGAQPNSVHRIRVRAFRSNVGSSGYTTSGDISTVLNAPSDLRAQTVLRNRVDITWTDNSAIETGYQVLFCAGAGCTPSSLAANLPAGTTSYQHTGLSQNVNYSWRIRAVSNATVAASVAAAGAYTPVSMGSGSVASGITDTLNAERYYVINVPAGTPELRITMTGGSGEADLHVRYGAAPTRFVYDCRPFPIGNEESCIIPNPAAGDWYFMPHAYQAITGVSVKSSLSTRYGYPTAFAVSGGWSPNYLIGQQLTITQAITLTHLGLQVAGGTGGVRIGLYQNAGGGIPGALVTQVVGTISTTGLVEFPTSAISVPAGTYWLMFNFQNLINRYNDGGTPSTVTYISYTYGAALPASFPLIGYTQYTGTVTNAHVRGYP